MLYEIVLYAYSPAVFFPTRAPAFTISSCSYPKFFSHVRERVRGVNLISQRSIAAAAESANSCILYTSVIPGREMSLSDLRSSTPQAADKETRNPTDQLWFIRGYTKAHNAREERHSCLGNYPDGKIEYRANNIE